MLLFLAGKGRRQKSWINLSNLFLALDPQPKCFPNSVSRNLLPFNSFSQSKSITCAHYVRCAQNTCSWRKRIPNSKSKSISEILLSLSKLNFIQFIRFHSFVVNVVRLCCATQLAFHPIALAAHHLTNSFHFPNKMRDEAGEKNLIRKSGEINNSNSPGLFCGPVISILSLPYFVRRVALLFIWQHKKHFPIFLLSGICRLWLTAAKTFYFHVPCRTRKHTHHDCASVAVAQSYLFTVKLISLFLCFIFVFFFSFFRSFTRICARILYDYFMVSVPRRRYWRIKREHFFPWNFCEMTKNVRI